MAMMGGPLLAASPHEVCDSMRHACDKIDALASCCCGDRSDNSPSQVPAGRAEVGQAPQAVMAALPAILPTAAHVIVRDSRTALARPPDLRILFSDLRI